MSGRLVGKVAVVTGGTGGIGRAAVEGFAREGASVAILARNRARMDAVIAGLPVPGLAVECNVGDQASVRAAFAAIAERFGGTDILVNNAAAMQPQLIAEADDTLMQREMGINFFGPIYTSCEAVAQMKPRGGGSIINISSEIVRAPFAFLGIYAAAKAALETVSAAMRSELREDNIRVMVLRSGYVKGSSLRAEWPKDIEERYFEWMARSGMQQNLGQPIEPETTGNMIVDLACLPKEANVDMIELRPI